MNLNWTQLVDSVEASLRELETYRKHYSDAVQAYAGDRWGPGKADVTSVNALSLYVQTISRTLVSKDPRVCVSTAVQDSAPVARILQDYENLQIERMNFADVAEEVVTSALFGFGMFWTSIATPGDAAASAWEIKAGEPFVAAVDPDDALLDMRAKRLGDMQYYGCRICIPKKAAESMWGKAAKELEVSENRQHNITGDDRVSQVGIDNFTNQDFEEQVEVWQIYLTRHRKIIYLPSHLSGAVSRHAGPLAEHDWVGPKRGPGRFLFLGPKTPGNLIGRAPVQDIIGLHEDLNFAHRKAMRMFSRMKENLLVKGDEKEALEVVNSEDGAVIRVKDPTNYTNVSFNGQLLQAVLGVGMALKESFNYQSGNVGILAGLQAQSGTAKQDQMLNANSSLTVSAMQDRVVAVVSDVLTDVAWFNHHNPKTTQRTAYKVPGLDYTLPRRSTPQDREQVPFEDLKLSVVPYSMSHQTPQQKAQALQQFVQTVLMPMLPMLNAQGSGINTGQLVRYFADWLDLPELLDVVQTQAPVEPQTQGGDGGDPMGKPPVTERTYNRVSQSQATPEGTTKDLMARFLGHDLGGDPGSAA